MPTTFIGGPAGAKGIDMRRAPRFLRVVVPIEQMDAFDVLDMLEDEPREGETVHVYEQLPGSYGCAFVCGRGRGQFSGRLAWGIYRYRDDVDGETLRDTAAWREWANSQP